MARTKSTPTNARLTETAPTGTPAGRHRSAFKNSEECIHRWAGRGQPEGHSANTFFSGGTLYSYGRHFPVARWVRVRRTGEVVVFFTSRGYSNTTSKHKREARYAIPNDVRVVTVANVEGDGVNTHLANLRAFETDAKYCLTRAAMPRVRQTTRASLRGEAARTFAEGNAYAELVGLRERIGPADPNDLEKWAAEAHEADLAEQKAAEAASKRAAEAYAAERAEGLAGWRDRLAAWKDGGPYPGECPDYSSPDAQLAFLRVRGRVVETSRRVAVPFRAARPVVEAVVNGTDLPEGFGVDAFALRGIDRTARLVTVGCHRIPFAEIERIAPAVMGGVEPAPATTTREDFIAEHFPHVPSPTQDD
jgi:hypothetical protein